MLQDGGPTRARKVLEERGVDKLNGDELRLLRAICRAQKDAACLSRVAVLPDRAASSTDVAARSRERRSAMTRSRCSASSATLRREEHACIATDKQHAARAALETRGALELRRSQSSRCGATASSTRCGSRPSRSRARARSRSSGRRRRGRARRRRDSDRPSPRRERSAFKARSPSPSPCPRRARGSVAR